MRRCASSLRAQARLHPSAARVVPVRSMLYISLLLYRSCLSHFRLVFLNRGRLSPCIVIHQECRIDDSSANLTPPLRLFIPPRRVPAFLCDRPAPRTFTSTWIVQRTEPQSREALSARGSGSAVGAQQEASEAVDYSKMKVPQLKELLRVSRVCVVRRVHAVVQVRSII